jgi:antitoxin (DNA-binding transcriptional repressor) of toxin-antitoxin stability system
MYYSNSFSCDTLDGLVLSMSPVRAQNPAAWDDDDDDALIYTMRDLNQRTASVMREIEKTGKPGFITRHGQFVAIITPLASGQVESRVLTEMAREIADRTQDEPAASVITHPQWSPAFPTSR